MYNETSKTFLYTQDATGAGGFMGIQNCVAAKESLPKKCGTMGKFIPADTRLTFCRIKH